MAPLCEAPPNAEGDPMDWLEKPGARLLADCCTARDATDCGLALWGDDSAFPVAAEATRTN